MIFGRHLLSKNQWESKIWETAWNIEDQYWNQAIAVHKTSDLLYKTLPKPRYLTWWHVANLFPHLMNICENMSKMVCGSSKLKCDYSKTRKYTFMNRACSLCGLSIEENPFHIVMQCPYHEPTRRQMYEEFGKVSEKLLIDYNDLNGEDKYLTLMGKYVSQIPNEEIMKLWQISGTFISMMYRQTIIKNEMYTKGVKAYSISMTFRSYDHLI